MTDYWRHKAAKSGYHTECKPCMRDRNNAWQQKHKAERHLGKIESLYKRRRDDPRYAIWKGCKDNAKQRGIPFHITVDDIVIPEFCPVLGIALKSNMGRGWSVSLDEKDRSPSIDRVDNKEGYTADNIVVVSFRANRIKSDASVDELRAIARWYGERHDSLSISKTWDPDPRPEARGNSDHLPTMLTPSSKEDGSLSFCEAR